MRLIENNNEYSHTNIFKLIDGVGNERKANDENGLFYEWDKTDKRFRYLGYYKFGLVDEVGKWIYYYNNKYFL